MLCRQPSAGGRDTANRHRGMRASPARLRRANVEMALVVEGDAAPCRMDLVPISLVFRAHALCDRFVDDDGDTANEFAAQKGVTKSGITRVARLSSDLVWLSARLSRPRVLSNGFDGGTFGSPISLSGNTRPHHVETQYVCFAALPAFAKRYRVACCHGGAAPNAPGPVDSPEVLSSSGRIRPC